MSEQPAHIGSYPVVREVGRGGMGVVYLARDPRLDRDVAIKVIPDAFAEDSERLARFEREARLLAALHHPNIAGIYGFEEADGRRFLALEYVEGETLAERLGRGPLPLDEAIDVCCQIAAALEAAHEQGIIHRDLKPGNVKLTPRGEVKVLDFGLAKGDTTSAVSNPSLSNSPTMTVGATGVGVILGTAAYMSPEQARGRAMDRRTDIWSLGCVLFECLTGRQAFAGETTSDMIARILQGEPEWAMVPARAPERLRVMLRRMLEKDARRRLRDVGDARIELEEIHAALGSSSGTSMSGAAHAPARRPAWLPPVAALLVGVAIGFFAIRATTPRVASIAPAGVRLAIEIPEGLQLFTEGLELAVPVALSPDGHSLVMKLVPRGGPWADRATLYVRDLTSTEFRPLPETHDVVGRPHVSRNGRDVLFVSGGGGQSDRRILWRVPIRGDAPPVQIFEGPEEWSGQFLPLPDGRFLVLDAANRLALIDASGRAAGAPVEIRPDRSTVRFSLDYADASAVLDERRVLLAAMTFDDRGWSTNVAVVDLVSGEARTVVRDAGHARVLPNGDLLFSRADAILQAPFDAASGELRGEPVAVLGGIRTFGAFAPGRFEAADNGVIVFGAGGRVAEARHLAIIDPSGRVERWDEWPKAYNFNFAPGVSGDGRWAAATATNARGIDEIWLSAIANPHVRRVVTTSEADVGAPVLSFDGGWIAFRATGADSISGVYVRRTSESGLGQRVIEGTRRGQVPTSWLPDAKGLTVMVPSGGAVDIRLVRFESDPEGPFEVTSLIQDGQRNVGACLSPDGRWLAFTSDRSGTSQAYVAPVQDGRVGPVTPLATSGVVDSWSAAGDRIFCVDSSIVFKSVKMDMRSPVRATGTERYFDFETLGLADGTAMPDGRFFGVLQSGEEFNVRHLDIVLGAFE